MRLFRGVGKGRSSYGHEVAFATAIGRTHAVNQDAGGAWTVSRADGQAASMVVVADGVSAGLHSEEASRLAVATIQDMMVPALESAGSLRDLLELLEVAVLEANRRVATRPYESLERADATTLAAAVAMGNDAGGVWCGDSRIYVLGADSIEQVTTDHSFAEEVVRQGVMTVEQAEADSRARMITRWLGPPADREPGLEWFDLQLAPGQTLLCCSDGVYFYFSGGHGSLDEMPALVSRNRLSQSLERIVALAEERGGHDDMTVAGLRVVSSS